MGPAYGIDGPFKASEQPWLLSNQRAAGIALQPYTKDGLYVQPHGYLRGTINPKLFKREQADDVARGTEPELEEITHE